jgi:mediator of RNA polymerase II transcription subunit 30
MAAAPYGSNNPSSLSPFSSQLSMQSSTQSMQLAIAAAGNIMPSAMSSSTSLPLLSVSPAAKDASPQTYSPTLLCRRGQETVQEIVARTSEVFQFLRAMVLPNGVNITQQQFHDRKAKLDEPCRQLEQLFRRLRLLYDKVNEVTMGFEPQPQVESLLSYEEDGESRQDQEKADEPRSDEERELIEQIQFRNRQIKEIIDQLRTVVWEINSMMAVRRTV